MPSKKKGQADSKKAEQKKKTKILEVRPSLQCFLEIIQKVSITHHMFPFLHNTRMILYTHSTQLIA